MQTVIATPTFLRQAAACRLDDAEIENIAVAIAGNPQGGDLIPGTGGARKMRHAMQGRGKSGGLRTIHYFGGEDIPVFLLAIYGKNEKADLSMAERNELSKLLPEIGRHYRKGRST